MLRVTMALCGTVLLLLAHPAEAYIWKCHTPNGDIWTSQPAPYGDCEEYDDVYNRVQHHPPPRSVHLHKKVPHRQSRRRHMLGRMFLHPTTISLATMDRGSI